MSVQGRVSQLEAAATAAETVLAWSEGAHAWGSLERYHLAMLDDANDAERSGTVLGEAGWSQWEASRRLPRDKRWQAYRAHHRDLVFLHRLVLLIEDILASEAVRLDTAVGRLTGGIDRLFPCGPVIDRSLATRWLDDAGAIVRGQRVTHHAIRELEARHLLGHPVAFPDTADAWARLERHLDDLRSMAEVLRETHLPDIDAPDWEPPEEEIERSWIHLARVARVHAHLELGEPAQALERMTRWGMPASTVAAPPEASAEMRPPEDLRSSAT